MLNIIEGIVRRPLKIVLYGSEGIGKSTLAAQFPGALFIDTESGTSHMNVRRIEKPSTWDGMIGIFNEVAVTPGICKTLVLDTADWAEMLCIQDILDKYKVSSLESFGYGKGYTYVGEEFAKLLAAADRVIAAGINVVITAHAKMRKFEQPDEMGSYDRWEMKLSKQVAPLLKEWSDLLLFLNYKTFVVASENKTNKAQGGKRVMYTTHHACWDAKNRFGLPEEMDLSIKGISHLFQAGSIEKAVSPIPAAEPTPASQPSPQSILRQMMERANVTDTQLQEVVASRSKYKRDFPVSEYPAEFINGWIIPYWKKIVAMIQSNQEVNQNG